MKPRLLVLTTVHHPDDVRIRGKLVEALRRDWQITYACRAPGPQNLEGFEVEILRGRRLARNLRSFALVFSKRYEVAALHDPETLPAGLLAAWIRRKKVVFDVHEDIPAQMLTKDRFPVWMRRPLALGLTLLLRLAERSIHMTLAEPGYSRRFRRQHPVFENLLPPGRLPKAEGGGSGVVYLGDITPHRGLYVLVEAMARSIPEQPLTLIGPCSSKVADHIRLLAGRGGVSVELTGRLPHSEALQRVARARVAVSPLLDIPNYRESQPTKLYEYLAVGVPVVASDLPGTRRAASGLDGVWFAEPGSIDAWAGALRRAVDDDELSEIARRQAPSVEDRLKFPAERVQDFYRRLVD